MHKEHSPQLGDTLFFAFMVLFIGSIVRIGASIYLPAMPLISQQLHISKALMSNTLTVYFVVFASFTLFAGMLSDAYGRKRILLAGMFFFMGGALICAFSDSYEMLLGGRAIQAFGASMVPGTLIAMIRDASSDVKSVSLMGWLTVLGGLFLVAAPMLGGVLTHLFGWEANFWFLAGFTLVVLLLTLLRMEETHAKEGRTPFSPAATFTHILKMLRTPSFILVLLPVVAFYGVQGAFLASAPFILMDAYGLSPVLFGISNINIVIGLFSGRYLGMYLLKRYGGAAVYRYGALLSIAVAVLFLLIAAGVIGGLWIFLLVSGLFATVFGTLGPLGMKDSVSAFRTTSGVAAALQSALLFTASALGSGAIGLLLHRFSTLGVETVFSLVTALLCLAAALAAFKQKA